MGMFSRLIGHADMAETSAAVEKFVADGEKILGAFKFMRDEIVVTDRGIFVVDVQGVTGRKKLYKYFPMRGLKWVSFESAGVFDLDADIHIGVDGNTAFHENHPYNKSLAFKIPKDQSEMGQEFFKLVKAALDRKGSNSV